VIGSGDFERMRLRASEAARIVEVGDKDVTERRAEAECVVSMTPEACSRLVEGTPKGDPIEAARVAGLMGVKRTPDLLPFCHPVAVTGADVVVTPDVDAGRIHVRTTVRARDRTGVEMEALTAAAVAGLSLYDTAKPFDRSARIDGLRLLAKSGGKSGEYRAVDGEGSPGPSSTS
jgi:cyclic pyranopterin phosphate synthase